VVWPRFIATVCAHLAATIEWPAAGVKLGVLLGLGVIAGLAAVAFWRRLQSERDPLRSLAPPRGPLRLARELKIKSTTDKSDLAASLSQADPVGWSKPGPGTTNPPPFSA
jgi:hypothetical protein